MNTKTKECKKCHKRFKVLVNELCLACDREGWNKFFDKIKGKGK